MNKNYLLLILIILSLFTSSLALAENTPIQTNSVFMPDNVSSGTCSELCDGTGTGDCDCEQNCLCAPGEECIHQTPDEKVIITLFYSETCPHCHELINFLDELSQDRDDFILDKYEVLRNETDRAYAQEFCEAKDVPFNSVPTYFIGDNYFVGYSDSMNEDILAAIDNVKSGETSNVSSSSDTFDFLFLKDLSASSMPPLVLAFALGFLDGFNPCAFFVLIFLLSMLVHLKSRKKMFLVAFIFILISAVMYFIFMSVWLNLFTALDSSNFMNVGGKIGLYLGLVAVVIGAINFKDFFAFKKGVSLSISDKNRKTLIKRMRGLLKNNSYRSIIIGTVVLGILANLYEFACTAIFPAIFTQQLVDQGLSTSLMYFYTLIYCLVYVIPLLIIVIIFVRSMNVKKVSQSQGEFLKLLSGLMALLFGLVLIFKGEVLSNGAAALVLILSSVILSVILYYSKKFITNKIKSRNEKKEIKAGPRKIKKGDEK